MTDTPTKIVVDCSTGAVEELALTADEIAQREADALAAVAQKAEDDAKAEADAIAKQAVLDRLGLTADEAKLLLA